LISGSGGRILDAKIVFGRRVMDFVTAQRHGKLEIAHSARIGHEVFTHRQTQKRFCQAAARWLIAAAAFSLMREINSLPNAWMLRPSTWQKLRRPTQLGRSGRFDR